MNNYSLSISSPNLSSQPYNLSSTSTKNSINEEINVYPNSSTIDLRKTAVFFENCRSIKNLSYLANLDQTDVGRSNTTNDNLITNLISDFQNLAEKLLSKEGLLAKFNVNSINFNQHTLFENTKNLIEVFRPKMDNFQSLCDWNSYHHQLKSNRFDCRANDEIKKIISDKKNYLENLFSNFQSLAQTALNNINTFNSNDMELSVRSFNEILEALPISSAGTIDDISEHALLENFDDFYNRHHGEMMLLKEMAARFLSTIELSVEELASNIQQQLSNRNSRNLINFSLTFLSTCSALILIILNDIYEIKHIHPYIPSFAIAIPVIISLIFCVNSFVNKSADSQIKHLHNDLDQCKKMSVKFNDSIRNYLEAFVPSSTL